MQKLIALNCQSCSAPLPDFINGKSKCENCGTKHFLTGFENHSSERHGIDGTQVVIPPSISIGQLLRANNFAADNYFPVDNYEDERESAIDLDEYEQMRHHSLEDKNELAVGVFFERTVQEEIETDSGGLFGFGRKTEMRNVQEKVVYFPFCMFFGGEQPFRLHVYGQDQLSTAAGISKLILQKLGYTVTIKLKRT